jgi:uncharacterized protein (TIGR02757 family)
MITSRNRNAAEILEEIYRKYHSPGFLRLDPLVVVREESRSAGEAELLGLVASCLSYGRAEQIIASIKRVLAAAGGRFTDFVLGTSCAEKRAALKSFKHRFNTGEDIAAFLGAVRLVCEEYGSLERVYREALDHGEGEAAIAMDRFASVILRHAKSAGRTGSRGLDFLLPAPSGGSACKRLNMYFRWMVRPDDGIDLGVWKSVPRSALIVPLDVHVFRGAVRLGLTARKAPDWRAAREVTDELRRIDPADPVRFDFSLCCLGKMEFRGAVG